MRKIKIKSKGCSGIALFVILGFLLYLPGCGGNAQPPGKSTAETTVKKDEKKAAPKAAKKSKASDKKVAAYHYDPMGKKDPFMPLIKESGKMMDRILGQGPLTPLQKYTLAELNLVAVILAGDNSKAMVEDAKGDGYIISKGTLIGDNYGEVVDIRDNEVLISEKEVDPLSGEIMQKEVSLILHKPEEEEL